MSKTRDELVKMYIDSLEEGELPWKKRWINSSNINRISKIDYKGINQLMLNYMTYKNKYTDNRWYTYKQIKNLGLKLKDAKGNGVPVEFWSIYDIKNKKRLNFNEYEKIIDKYPDKKDDVRIINRTAIVFNGDLVEGLEKAKVQENYIDKSKYISKLIKKMGIEYEELGDQAFYSPTEDKIVLPNKDKFYDKYSYYATQLHELSHATGNPKRLNRNIGTNDKKEYAREELVAEISSSFLMQYLGIPSTAEHIDNHKAYIQSWISILKDKPNELFKAISESNKVCDYVDTLMKVREREER